MNDKPKVIPIKGGEVLDIFEGVKERIHETTDMIVALKKEDDTVFYAVSNSWPKDIAFLSKILSIHADEEIYKVLTGKD